MKYSTFILFVAILLSGCQSVTIGKPWPILPDKQKEFYLTPCESLELVKLGDGVSEIVGNVEQNYQKWHTCNLKTKSWIEWYTKHWQNKEK